METSRKKIKGTWLIKSGVQKWCQGQFSTPKMVSENRGQSEMARV